MHFLIASGHVSGIEKYPENRHYSQVSILFRPNPGIGECWFQYGPTSASRCCCTESVCTRQLICRDKSKWDKFLLRSYWRGHHPTKQFRVLHHETVLFSGFHEWRRTNWRDYFFGKLCHKNGNYQTENTYLQGTRFMYVMMVLAETCSAKGYSYHSGNLFFFMFEV